MNLNELKKNSLVELSKQASELGLKVSQGESHSELLLRVLRTFAKSGGSVSSTGILEILGDGFGFLRSSQSDYSPSPEDVYVSPSQIRRFHLNTGDKVSGIVRPPKESERYFALLRVEKINGLSADKAKTSLGFTERKAIPTTEPLIPNLSIPAAKLFNTLCPLAKGQRVLVYVPPRCHGSTLFLELAKAYNKQPNLEVISLLISERPEFINEYKGVEVGELVSSSFEEPVQRHTQISDMVLENIKRKADSGKDVVVLVNSITRLASAASQSSPSSSSNLPSGLSVKGVQNAKRLLAAGRNLDGAGSVTLLVLVRDASGLINSYLRHEFTDTANCEIQLSTQAAAEGCIVPLERDGFFNVDEEKFLSPKARKALEKQHKALTEATDYSLLRSLQD